MKIASPTTLARLRRFAKIGVRISWMVENEVKMWFEPLLRSVPGRIGCLLRNILLPYRHGRHVAIATGVRILYPRNLTIGHWVSINVGSVIHAGGGVIIGNHVLIGRDVHIYTNNHRFANPEITIDQQSVEFKQVVIESNVWIASNVTIVPGVRIGANSVIAAASVVTKDVPTGVLVAGNPARVKTFLREKEEKGKRVQNEKYVTKDKEQTHKSSVREFIE